MWLKIDTPPSLAPRKESKRQRDHRQEQETRPNNEKKLRLSFDNIDETPCDLEQSFNNLDENLCLSDTLEMLDYEPEEDGLMDGLFLTCCFIVIYQECRWSTKEIVKNV